MMMMMNTAINVGFAVKTCVLLSLGFRLSKRKNVTFIYGIISLSVTYVYVSVCPESMQSKDTTVKGFPSVFIFLNTFLTDVCLIEQRNNKLE